MFLSHYCCCIVQGSPEFFDHLLEEDILAGSSGSSGSNSKVGAYPGTGIYHLMKEQAHSMRKEYTMFGAETNVLWGYMLVTGKAETTWINLRYDFRIENIMPLKNSIGDIEIGRDF
jgi:hypothetical protein